MNLSSVPTWVWILLLVAAVIVVPIKLKILQRLLQKKETSRDLE